ncbi:hypothetical protein ACHAPT_007832 [Fusarium lateritium]
MSSYNYEDDDVYTGHSCCMNCCRALDFGNHDACAGCYCRRSLKPDYDPDIYPGWSLGHYYPGSRLEDWTEPLGNAEPSTNASNREAGRGDSSQQTAGQQTTTAPQRSTAASETRAVSEKTPAVSQDFNKAKDDKKAKSKGLCKHPKKQ